MFRTKRRRNKKQPKPRPVRNWLVVDARTRHTAGQMGDQRKEESRNECRKYKHKRGSGED